MQTSTTTGNSGTGLRILSLQALVLFSLIVQFMLVIVAPWRKNHKLIIMLNVVQIGYLLESGVSNFAMGLIPGSTGTVEGGGGRTEELGVYWAPFLILHLGGPSSITGLSLSDNELWLRHAARLVPLSYTFGRVFLRSFLKKDVWVPTAIMFFAGTLRYIEKAICRFLARETKFRDSVLPKPDLGVNHAKLIETYGSFLESSLPVQSRKSTCSSTEQCLTRFDQRCPSSAQRCPSSAQPSSKIKLRQVQIVKEGFRFFRTFGGLFVNSVYSYDQRDESREYFLSRDAEEAFSICEVELNFVYDVFFTKSIMNGKPILRWLNLVSFILQVVSAVFWIQIDHSSFRRSSVYVTNALVYGSISLDLFSFFILATSNWVIALENHNLIECFYEKLLLFKKGARERQRKFSRGYCRLFFRWSELIPQFNLVRRCLLNRPLYPQSTFYRKHLIPAIPYVTVYFFRKRLKPKGGIFTTMLRDFIFSELVIRSSPEKQPIDVVELCSSRGLWVLNLLSQKHLGLTADKFKPWITDVDFEESLILWHIATTICYYTHEDHDEIKQRDDDLRECSIILGDYMLLLLIWKEWMPNSVRILGRKIFLDTFADAERFFDRKLPLRNSKAVETEELIQQACKKIMQVNTDLIPPREIRGDESKSVLFDGCRLAKELQRLNKDTEINIWEIISKVWAEMLFHCAAQSNASMHLEWLSNGGELLTLVWLLMAHLGLGEKQFRYNNDRGGELVIGEHTKIH